MKQIVFALSIVATLFLASTGAAYASGGPGTPTTPTTVIQQIKGVTKKYDVPVAIIIPIIRIESDFNPYALGNGCDYGLFQLAYPGGEGAQAIRDGYSVSALYDPYINAKYAMPSIANAWDTLRPNFDSQSLYWWARFSSLSGHPSLSGNMSDPVVWAFASKLEYWYNYYQTNPLEFP